jgi:hypothetical protein
MMIRAEVLDQLHLPLGLAAAEGNGSEARLLHAVMRAESAGEQAIAVADVHLVAAPGARGADRARHDRGPGVDVARV